MTSQQELELLAEWLGIEIAYVSEWNCGVSIMLQPNPTKGAYEWNPSPEGNDTDFLNMVAGRVDIDFEDTGVMAYGSKNYDIRSWESFHDHNNDPVQAMKHAAYRVCLMAAREWKGEQK